MFVFLLRDLVGVGRDHRVIHEVHHGAASNRPWTGANVLRGKPNPRSCPSIEFRLQIFEVQRKRKDGGVRYGPGVRRYGLAVRRYGLGVCRA